MSLNDQFDMARNPLKPLPYSSRSEGQCNEIMIDYGENASYHIYIVHHTDDTKYIDITNTIVKEITETGAAINGDKITINIEGIQDPQELGDILNTIWKKYLFPDDETGFDVSRDLYKIYLDSTTSILLTNNDGTIFLPVTTAENVFDAEGNSIQSRLDEMTKFAWSIDYIYVGDKDANTFEFSYPFNNYSDFMEVRIGTTYIDQTRYTVTPQYNTDGDLVGGILTFNRDIEAGRRIDLIFMFNALTSGTGASESNSAYISGSNIANGTITSSKLAKTSDSYTLNDSSSIATSAAVYNLYQELVGMIMDEDHAGLYFDTSSSSSSISISIDFSLSGYDYYFFYVVTNCAKSSSTTFNITGSSSRSFSQIYDLEGNKISSTISSGQLIKVLYKNNQVYLINSGGITLNTTRLLYRAKDQDTTISFNGLQYDAQNSIINVYRNSMRLFEDIDYSIDMVNETITLYVRTEATELIIFEAITALNN